MEEEFTLNMKTSKSEDNRAIIFESMPGEKEEIANLMASYSPAHQNWQKVGEAPVTMVGYDQYVPHLDFNHMFN